MQIAGAIGGGGDGGFDLVIVDGGDIGGFDAGCEEEELFGITDASPVEGDFGGDSTLNSGWNDADDFWIGSPSLGRLPADGEKQKGE